MGMLEVVRCCPVLYATFGEHSGRSFFVRTELQSGERSVRNAPLCEHDAHKTDMRMNQVQSIKCSACKDGVQPPFAFSMAFQPIVDIEAHSVFAYEALVRGVRNESAYSILSQVNEQNRYAFDQNCRVRAITLAAELGLVETGARLSINFMPGAVYSPAACIQLTLKTAASCAFPLDRLIFEMTETEEIRDVQHLLQIVGEYRKHGFRMAIDDYGAGYSGLNLLADFRPDILKLDMKLIRNIHQRPVAQAIVRSTVDLCATLGTDLIAEGVETIAEYDTVKACGIHLMQGYLLAKPAFEALPEFTLPQERLTLPLTLTQPKRRKSVAVVPKPYSPANSTPLYVGAV